MFDAILLGIALAMDSFTISIVNGITYKKYTDKDVWLTSFSFGLFQGLMPLLGYILLIPIIKYIESFDHWVVLIVLSLIGINMIKESFNADEIKDSDKQYTFKIMIMESIATSIDALSSCIILPTFKISPYLTCLIIIIITFVFCLIGHKLGKQIGLKLKDKASILGGLILILLGVKCVLEHLGIL